MSVAISMIMSLANISWSRIEIYVHIRFSSAEELGPISRTILTHEDPFFQSNLLLNLSRNEAPDILCQTPGRSNSPTAEPSLPLLLSLHHDHSTLGKLWEKRQGKLCCYWLESSIPEWAGYWYYQWDNTKKPSPLAGNLPRFLG